MCKPVFILADIEHAAVFRHAQSADEYDHPLRRLLIETSHTHYVLSHTHTAFSVSSLGYRATTAVDNVDKLFQ